MYGVLYAISPEIFPAKDRGTGNALVSTTTRVFGVVVSVALHTRVPLYLLFNIIFNRVTSNLILVLRMTER